MSTTALLQVEGLPCRLIEELMWCEREQRVRGRFAGQVLKATKDDKFSSFIVSDGTASAEVTLVHRRIQTEDLLPVRGESVLIVGHGFRKVMGGKHEYSFLKILALSLSRVSVEEELRVGLEATRGLKERIQEVHGGAMEKARPLRTHRGFDTASEQQEVRTLILNYCYFFFQSNPDLHTSIVHPQMIRCSSCGREFMQTFGTTRDALDEALARTISALLAAGLVCRNERGQNQVMMRRQLLKGIQKSLEERIQEMGSKGGVRIDQLTAYANKKIAEYANIDYQVFNWKFVQKLLTRMQADNKIYKTSDKLIFPNSRF